ncbi:acetylcholine receptor protein alpha 1, partial [Wuchereria bancrofti]
DEKNQILTTNLWLEMQWNDSKLTWDPSKYGGITTLHIPSDQIWTPDLVLYNKCELYYVVTGKDVIKIGQILLMDLANSFPYSAAGDPDITIFTDALVAYDGR